MVGSVAIVAGTVAVEVTVVVVVEGVEAVSVVVDTTSMKK